VYAPQSGCAEPTAWHLRGLLLSGVAPSVGRPLDPGQETQAGPTVVRLRAALRRSVVLLLHERLMSETFQQAGDPLSVSALASPFHHSDDDREPLRWKKRPLKLEVPGQVVTQVQAVRVGIVAGKRQRRAAEVVPRKAQLLRSAIQPGSMRV
jgi:hypothetical protein